jgi:hypothetical protein
MKFLTIKKLIPIILIACIGLAGFSFYGISEVKKGETKILKPIIKLLPFSEDKKEEISFLLEIFPEIGGFEKEKTYFLLFENNMELRPAGGYLGSFGIIKVKKGKFTHLEIHDTNIFDGFGKIQTEPPWPIKKYLNVSNWQMRDSGWSPDFPTAAKKAEYFYHLQGGKEKFDGIIAITPPVLESVLNLTGSLEFEGHNYTKENVILDLEYQVEQNYYKKGIPEGERKSVLKKIAPILAERIVKFSILDQIKLFNCFEKHFKEKEIILYFHNSELENKILEKNWGGQIKKNPGDYLMIVDANLFSLKSDPVVERSIDYQIDLNSPRLNARLEITYRHQGKEENWHIKDYQSYLRVYLPKGSWLTKVDGLSTPVEFPDELEKTVFAGMVYVPLNKEKKVVFEYLLPKDFKKNPYKLLVQKQIGTSDYDLKIEIISKKGQRNFSQKLKEDLYFEIGF